MSGPKPTPVTLENSGTSASRQVEYLSRPAQVSMTDGYFELASLDHFWVRRRFEVFQKLAGALVQSAKEIADVGCGHGMLQRQVEEAYGREVTGFDLNEGGLKRNLSRSSKVFCYNVFERNPTFQARFDLIFLWDVIEHIADEDSFLKAVMFHLAPGGNLAVNVPAGRWAFSGYDRAAGHVRRYSHKTLLEALHKNGLKVRTWSYWGLPFLPTLAFRKLWLRQEGVQQRAYSTGFAVSGNVVNTLCRVLSHMELIPQKLAGTSVMAVAQPFRAG
jgi:2-polyprenyl-3-methyl-5-hydroxy-6-metoxy-1,4-benzoquinol methylase